MTLSNFKTPLALLLAAGLALPALAETPAPAGGAAPAEAARTAAISASGAFTRATLPGAPVAGGFVTLANSGSTDDRLVAAETDIAGRTEIHEMAMQDGVMRMRPLPDGLPLPAGETIELRPGGYHLMFLDLRQPLVEGESIAVTLHFETAPPMIIDLAVQAPGAKSAGAGHGAMGHGEMTGGGMTHGDMGHGAMGHDGMAPGAAMPAMPAKE